MEQFPPIAAVELSNDDDAKFVKNETKPISSSSRDPTSRLVPSTSSGKEFPFEPRLATPMNKEQQERMESEISELKEELRLKRKELEDYKCQIVGLNAAHSSKVLKAELNKIIEIKELEKTIIRKEYEKQLLQKDIDRKVDARSYEYVIEELKLKEKESKNQRLQKDKEAAEERAMTAEKKCKELTDELKRLSVDNAKFICCIT